jgi:MCP family monocarboxylic acid transporter-like MFS transporter 10
MPSPVAERSPSEGGNTINWSEPASPKMKPEYSPDERLPAPTVDNGESDEPTWPREWQAYVTLTGCFFLMFNSWGLVNAYGTFSSYYKEDLLPGGDLLLLNLVGSTESFIVLINSWWIGRLLDSGHSRYIVFAGWILVSLGMFTLSLSSGDGGFAHGNYALIWLTQGFTTGLGMACFFVASSQSRFSRSCSKHPLIILVVASTWFAKRKSFAIGIVASGASIGMLEKILFMIHADIEPQRVSSTLS